MDSEEEILEYINKRYTEIKTRNPSFSVRAFAKKVEVSPSYLNLILNGKRKLTKAVAEKMLKALGVNKYDRLELVSHLDISVKKSAAKKDAELEKEVYKYFELDKLQDIIDSKPFLIRQLVNCSDFQDDDDYIYEKTGINPKLFRRALNSLIDLGLIKKNALGNYYTTNKPLFYKALDTQDSKKLQVLQGIDEIRSIAERFYEKISEDDLLPSKSFAFIFPTNSKFVEKVIDEMRIFKDRIILDNQSYRGKPDEVYSLHLSLAPLTEKVVSKNDQYQRVEKKNDKKSILLFVDRKLRDQYIFKLQDQGIDYKQVLAKIVEDEMRKKLEE